MAGQGEDTDPSTPGSGDSASTESSDGTADSSTDASSSSDEEEDAERHVDEQQIAEDEEDLNRYIFHEIRSHFSSCVAELHTVMLWTLPPLTFHHSRRPSVVVEMLLDPSSPDLALPPCRVHLPLCDCQAAGRWQHACHDAGAGPSDDPCECSGPA